MSQLALHSRLFKPAGVGDGVLHKQASADEAGLLRKQRRGVILQQAETIWHKEGLTNKPGNSPKEVPQLVAEPCNQPGWPKEGSVWDVRAGCFQ